MDQRTLDERFEVHTRGKVNPEETEEEEPHVAGSSDEDHVQVYTMLPSYTESKLRKLQYVYTGLQNAEGDKAAQQQQVHTNKPVDGHGASNESQQPCAYDVPMNNFKTESPNASENQNGTAYSSLSAPGMYMDVLPDSYPPPTHSSSSVRISSSISSSSHGYPTRVKDKDQEVKAGKTIGNAIQMIHQMDAEKLKDTFLEFVESLDTEHEKLLLSEFVGFIEEREEAQQRTKKKLNKSRSTSGIKRKDLEFDRRWNEDFQTMVEKRYDKLIHEEVLAFSRLLHDFVHNAETYAKVIINEQNVPYSRKTIKPAGVGGFAGGEKFVVQGILFKFCLDPEVSDNPKTWLYGGNRPRDDRAMKAAGLELQGVGLAMTCMVPELHFPLIAMIDYKGFRVLATSVLPLGPNTLRYGSNDGGDTVLASDPKFNKLMKRIGKCLNLKKHCVGKNRVRLVGPGDIEGHLGMDGRYYLLDLARLMPPEDPSSGDQSNDRGVFYKKLRPELVRKFPSPLCSDSFTGWGYYDVDRLKGEADIREATRIMFEIKIPELAKELDSIDISDLYHYLEHTTETDVTKLRSIASVTVNLVYRMHSKGINLRHLGRLRQQVTDKNWRHNILTEATARVCKHLLKKKMRNSIKNQSELGVSSETAIRKVVLEHLRTLMGCSPQSEWLWKVNLKRVLAKRFPHILTEEESQEDYDLKRSLSMKLLMIIIKRWKMIHLREELIHKIIQDLPSVCLGETDIEDVTAIVEHMPLTYMIDAQLCRLEASNSAQEDALRFLSQARFSLLTAANKFPSVGFISWKLGQVELQMAQIMGALDQHAKSFFKSACKRFETALQLEPIKQIALDWADALELDARTLEEKQLQTEEKDMERVNQLRDLARQKRAEAETLKEASFPFW